MYGKMAKKQDVMSTPMGKAYNAAKKAKAPAMAPKPKVTTPKPPKAMPMAPTPKATKPMAKPTMPMAPKPKKKK